MALQVGHLPFSPRDWWELAVNQEPQKSPRMLWLYIGMAHPFPFAVVLHNMRELR